MNKFYLFIKYKVRPIAENSYLGSKLSLRGRIEKLLIPNGRVFRVPLRPVDEIHVIYSKANSFSISPFEIVEQ